MTRAALSRASAQALRASAWLWLGICVACTASACESGAQKCAKARAAAGLGWSAYVETLEQARIAAQTTQRDAQRALSTEVEPRLAPLAQKAADGRYPRSSEAWLRAYRIAYEQACVHDAVCDGLRSQRADAQGTLEDFVDRLPLARAALRACSGEIEAAKAAAKAAVPHPEYPQLKQAQQLTQIAYDRCKSLPAPKPTAK